MLNAKDYKNTLRIIKLSLKDGWRLKKTWKDIVYPLLGKRIVGAGIVLKRVLR